MRYLRWYDKSKEFSGFMDLMQSLPEDYYAMIAQDMLQILFNEGVIDVNTSMDVLNTKNNYSYNRWYDSNYELSNALEVIKTLNNSQRERVILKISESIYQTMQILSEHQDEQ